MKTAILYGAGDLRLDERPLDPDSLRPEEVYVETEVTALSTGTDLGNYLGDSTYVPGAPDYPRQIGYSNVGKVCRVGENVRALGVGQRVFSLRPHQSAFIARQDELLVPVPPQVPSEQAALAYLTHLGLAALRQARYEPGENVAVVGLGVIGLCTAGLARAMGASVLAVANSELRARKAAELGAHRSPVWGDAGADIVVLTANTWEAYRLSVDLARYGGRVSILGFPGRAQPAPDFNPFDPRWFYAKQLTILGAGAAPTIDCPPTEIRFNRRRNLAYILDLMASGALNLEPVISHRLPAARMKEAYELAANHSKELIAAVFDWREEHS